MDVATDGANLVVTGHAPGDAAVERGLHLDLGNLRLALLPGLLGLPHTDMHEGLLCATSH